MTDEIKYKEKKGFMDIINAIVPINKDFSIKSLFTFEKTPLNMFVAVMVIGLVLVMIAGVANFLMHGHHAYNVTREHPWGLLISSYAFFVGTSTGLCIIASFGHIFGIKEFNAIGTRTTFLAIVTLLSGFAVIIFEIGHPFRMIVYNVISPGITSAIWWMGTLYSFVLTFLILEFIFTLRGDHKKSKILGTLGLVADLAAFSTLGSIFAYLVARPISNGPFYPLYFILTAMVAGSFVLFIIYGFKYKMDFPEKIKTFLVKLSKILGLLLAILMFFEFWRVLTAIYGGMPERADTMLHIIKGANFQLEVVFGMIIPFFIIVLSKGQALKATVFASIGGIISIFFMRSDMVHNTQVFPMQTLKIREYQVAPTWVEYFPSATEIMISVGAVGLCVLLYFVGTKLFDLEDHGEH